MRRVLAAALAVALLTAVPASAHPRDTSTIAALEARVADLERRVAVLEAPAPTPTPAPTSGWTEAFHDHFLAWDPSRYFVYPAGWKDTEEQARPGMGGFYSGDANISVANSNLSIRLFTDTAPRATAFVPLPDGSSTARGDLLGMRTEIKLRADAMAGWKVVPLLWPQDGNPWPFWGEINWPEGDTDEAPAAFMHRQGATVSNDQDWYPSPAGTSLNDWHVYGVEWIPGVSCTFTLDGKVIGRSTARVPEGPMHWVLQFETSIDGTRPPSSVSGFVQIDYVTVWSRS